MAPIQGKGATEPARKNITDVFWQACAGDKGERTPQRVVSQTLNCIESFEQGRALHPQSGKPMTLMELLADLGMEEDLVYASPELVRGESFDERSLVFTIGVLIFERLTDRHPFGTSDNQMRIARLRRGEMGSGVNFFPSVPKELREILMRAMGPFPEERYRELEELKNDLRRFIGHPPKTVQRSPSQTSASGSSRSIFSDVPTAPSSGAGSQTPVFDLSSSEIHVHPKQENKGGRAILSGPGSGAPAAKSPSPATASPTPGKSGAPFAAAAHSAREKSNPSDPYAVLPEEWAPPSDVRKAAMTSSRGDARAVADAGHSKKATVPPPHSPPADMSAKEAVPIAPPSPDRVDDPTSVGLASAKPISSTDSAVPIWLALFYGLVGAAVASVLFLFLSFMGSHSSSTSQPQSSSTPQVVAQQQGAVEPAAQEPRRARAAKEAQSPSPTTTVPATAAVPSSKSAAPTAQPAEGRPAQPKSTPPEAVAKAAPSDKTPEPANSDPAITQNLKNGHADQPSSTEEKEPVTTSAAPEKRESPPASAAPVPTDPKKTETTEEPPSPSSPDQEKAVKAAPPPPARPGDLPAEVAAGEIVGEAIRECGLNDNGEKAWRVAVYVVHPGRVLRAFANKQQGITDQQLSCIRQKAVGQELSLGWTENGFIEWSLRFLPDRIAVRVAGPTKLRQQLKRLTN